MATTTNRLKIPKVEDTETLSAELWNRSFEQIDSVCIGFVTLGSRTLTFSDGKATVDFGVETLQEFRFLDVYPTDPSNEENWLAIARATLRCYLDADTPNRCYLVAQGTIPDSVSVTFVGWY